MRLDSLLTSILPTPLTVSALLLCLRRRWCWAF